MADPATSNDTAVVVRRVLNAPPERVFNAWTDAAQYSRWFNPMQAALVSADVDAREGGSFRLTFVGPQKVPFSVKGIYKKVQPNDVLQFTWIWDDEELNVGETLVTIELSAIGSQTELVLTHELLPTEEARTAHAAGWTSLVESLGKYVEGE